jgi:hypothetical protein
MFQDDYDRVAKWVLTYPDRETGGQMFGLWRDDRKPYVNIIIGPGQNCSHGTHSFHQDIDYLKNVGTFLNTEYMMCHIGEWHSHHKLRLRQPSSGDLNSIWRHFPAGVEHFLLIIATIENGGVRLNPWLFTASTHKYEGIGNASKCIVNTCQYVTVLGLYLFGHNCFRFYSSVTSCSSHPTFLVILFFLS